MKKTGLIVFLTLLIALVIAGCGNSKLDPLVSPTGPYMFINASSTDVNESNADYQIFIQLLKDGFGDSGQEVRISPFDVSLGYVRPSTVETDEDGWAIYTYHSPSDVKKLIGQSLTLSAVYDDGEGIVLFGNIILNFVAPAPIPPPPCDGNSTCSGGSSCSSGTCPSAPSGSTPCSSGTCPSAP